MDLVSPPSTAAAPMVTQAEEQLRRDLVSGRLEPGTRLKMQELQEVYGFSSTPLREALNRLSQVGLIQADDRRGFRVPDLSLEEFMDITRLRTLIDTDGLARSIDFGDDDWEGAHKAFHMELLSHARSVRTLQLSSVLFDQADRYRRVSARMRTRPRNKSNEHKMIMEAALARESDKACELLRAHMHHTLGNVTAALAILEKSPRVFPSPTRA